jgi:hypothetical protein
MSAEAETFPPSASVPSLHNWIPAVCAKGHAVYVGSGQLYARRGEIVRWGQRAFRCHCGAFCYGGGLGEVR